MRAIAGWLRQLHQYAAGGCWMYKSYQCTARSNLRLIVNKSGLALFEAVQLAVDIFNSHANVMQAGAFPGQELANGRVGSHRLEELNVSVSCI